MEPGDLHQSVAFDAPASADDGLGGTEIGWSEEFTARAHYRFLRGGETVQAARLDGRQPVVVTVRNCSDARMVTNNWRMRDVNTGKVYNVRADPVPSDDRIWMEILVESGVAV